MDNLIDKTIIYVKETLSGAEVGHDWSHIERVYRMALRINQVERGDQLVVSLAALLHDIADSKFYDGDENVGPQRAKTFMESNGVSPEVITKVVHIIENISYKNEYGEVTYHSKELDIVQDADRLDAIGAIGIARTFNYGGFKNRPLYDPAIKPNLNHTKESYKATDAPTINHFFEKLLLLKDKMNTPTARKIAEQRHQFMEQYLEQFFDEWNAER